MVLNKTTFGYELKAVGLNKNAARYAGAPTSRVELAPASPRPLEPRTPLALSPSLICAPADPSSTSPSLRARQSAAATNHRRPSPFPRRR